MAEGELEPAVAERVGVAGVEPIGGEVEGFEVEELGLGGELSFRGDFGAEGLIRCCWAWLRLRFGVERGFDWAWGRWVVGAGLSRVGDWGDWIWLMELVAGGIGWEIGGGVDEVVEIFVREIERVLEGVCEVVGAEVVVGRVLEVRRGGR